MLTWHVPSMQVAVGAVHTSEPGHRMQLAGTGQSESATQTGGRVSVGDAPPEPPEAVVPVGHSLTTVPVFCSSVTLESHAQTETRQATAIIVMNFFISFSFRNPEQVALLVGVDSNHDRTD